MRQQAVAKLGLEPGGLRRHDAAAVRNLPSGRPRSPGTSRTPRRRARSPATRAGPSPRAPDEVDPLVGPRTSPMPSSGASTWSCRRPTSSCPARSVPAGAGVISSVCHARRGTSPPRPSRRRRRARLDAVHSRSRQQRRGRVSTKVLDDAVVGKDLRLVVGKRHGEERVPFAGGGALRKCLPARAALAAR